jgi:phage gp46-like protein
MTDVRLYQTPDGGETTWVNGQPITANGLETAAYLSMFGGNQEDSGLTDGESKQWWANFEEPVAERRQRSQVQALLAGIPATPFNLRRIEDAANADLAWMVKELTATIEVEATLPALNRVRIRGAIVIAGTRYPFDFSAPWTSS